MEALKTCQVLCSDYKKTSVFGTSASTSTKLLLIAMTRMLWCNGGCSTRTWADVKVTPQLLCERADSWCTAGSFWGGMQFDFFFGHAIGQSKTLRSSSFVSTPWRFDVPCSPVVLW